MRTRENGSPNPTAPQQRQQSTSKTAARASRVTVLQPDTPDAEQPALLQVRQRLAANTQTAWMPADTVRALTVALREGVWEFFTPHIPSSSILDADPGMMPVTRIKTYVDNPGRAVVSLYWVAAPLVQLLRALTEAVAVRVPAFATPLEMT